MYCIKQRIEMRGTTFFYRPNQFTQENSLFRICCRKRWKLILSFYVFPTYKKIVVVDLQIIETKTDMFWIWTLSRKFCKLTFHVTLYVSVSGGIKNISHLNSRHTRPRSCCRTVLSLFPQLDSEHFDWTINVVVVREYMDSYARWVILYIFIYVLFIYVYLGGELVRLCSRRVLIFNLSGNTPPSVPITLRLELAWPIIR
jgi:hypothetical protein